MIYGGRRETTQENAEHRPKGAQICLQWRERQSTDRHRRGGHLYREIRVENTLTDEAGKKSGLPPGEEASLVIEADADAVDKVPAK